jgi:transcriptional regulator GlxA family with amidase domain
MTRDRKLIAFTLYPGVTPLDIVGPLTVLRKVAPDWPFETVAVGERVEPLATDTSLQFVPAATFDQVRAPFAVLVPGGGAATLDALDNVPLLEYVRSAARSADVVGSTGNGALVLAAAGLLQGRRAAIHPAYADQLRRLGAEPALEKWRADGKLFTAGGGTAGIDLMIYLVARFKSERSARLAQLMTEYDPHPPFGQTHRTALERSLSHVGV